MQRNPVSQIATAGILVGTALIGSSTQAQIALYDAALHDQFGFNFGDMTTDTTGGVLNIFADGFGGSGSDLTQPIVPVDFDAATAQLEVTLTVNAANVANDFRIVLIDQDSVDPDPLAGEEFQFFVDISGVNVGQQVTLTQDLTNPGPVFNQTIFGGLPGDNTQNYGLRQIQIQSVFGSSDVLDIAVESVAITPEPGSLLLSAAGLGLLLRRRTA